MTPLVLFLVLLFTTPAAAAILDIAVGETTYWPSGIPATVYGQSFTVPDTATLTIDAAHDIHVGAFAYDSVLLDIIPPGTYVCPAGQVCALNQFGLSVIVQGNAVITPGTGDLGLIGSPPPIAAADGDGFVIALAGLIALVMIGRRAVA
jgi:hypothetical protein